MQSHLKPLLKQINECTPYFSINNFDDRTCASNKVFADTFQQVKQIRYKKIMST